jgi:PAS domain-containing protein
LRERRFDLCEATAPEHRKPASRVVEFSLEFGVVSTQRPLELILARNLLSSISTPAFLVGELGALLYYNEAAAAMLGRRYEEGGHLAAADWTREFGPFGEDGAPIPYDEIPATVAVRSERPFHGRFRVHTTDGLRDVAASAIPIVGPGGSSGAIVFFWPVQDGAEAIAGQQQQGGAT